MLNHNIGINCGAKDVRLMLLHQTFFIPTYVYYDMNPPAIRAVNVRISGYPDKAIHYIDTSQSLMAAAGIKSLKSHNSMEAWEI